MESTQKQGQQRRQKTAGKISKVKFLFDENYDGAERFVSGSWGNEESNSVAVWSTSKEPSDESSGIQMIGQFQVPAGVNDLFALSSTQFVAGLVNGDVSMFDCKKRGVPSIKETFAAVHNRASSTALCVVGNEIFSGSDTGTIVRIPLDGGKPSILSTDLMEVTCLIPCTASQLISAHSTDQIHLWDLRLAGKYSGAMSILGKIPAISKAVTSLNDDVTTVACHPAQPNVLAVGTISGNVSFLDIRQPGHELPNLLQICEGSVNHVSFHPIYCKNFFSCSDSGLIHWDACSLSDEPVQNTENQAYGNVWLSGKVWNNIHLKSLVEDGPKLLISTFDVAHNSIVVGSNTSELLYMDNLKFY